MSLTIKNPTYLKAITSTSILLAITACSNGQVEQSRGYTPKEGEYGKQLVTSIKLTSEQIDLLNSEQLPKPYNQLSEEQKLAIEFPVNSELNPYRVVIFAHGNAKKNGLVDVTFAGMLNKANAQLEDRPTPQLYREEDTNDYRVSQNLILAVNSEPFSFPLYISNEQYRIETGLSKRANFHFESVEIQIWQGDGEKRSQYSYYKLFIGFFIAGLLVYRMFFARL